MELKQVGYFSKTHGVKGHLVLKEDLLMSEEARALFLETKDGGKAPYFISELKESQQGWIVKLEEVNAVEQAKLLIGKKVFVEAKWVEEEEAEFDWIGYEVIDAQHGLLGRVDGMTDNSEQVLLSLQYKGKEVILPLVEEFIDRVDETNRQLFFRAPEGLVELYLDDTDQAL